jgi:hypothetical protein
VEPSLEKTTKQLKVTKASSSIRALTQRGAIPSLPKHGSDDDRVEICSMLGVVSTISYSSSSLSDLSALESTRGPQLNPDMVIWSAVIVVGSKLPVIPEMSELDTTQSEMEGMGLSDSRGAGGSTVMFMYKLKLHFIVLGPADLAFLCR